MTVQSRISCPVPHYKRIIEVSCYHEFYGRNMTQPQIIAALRKETAFKRWVAPTKDTLSVLFN